MAIALIQYCDIGPIFEISTSSVLHYEVYAIIVITTKVVSSKDLIYSIDSTSRKIPDISQIKYKRNISIKLKQFQIKKTIFIPYPCLIVNLLK